jgi:hypothetical protein
MLRWKSRAGAFTVCFLIGLLAALASTAIFNLFAAKKRPSVRSEQPSPNPCAADDYFVQPEDVLSALKNAEVNVRREMFKRLFLRPDIKTVYYDYERDLNYPERADHVQLTYVQLDDSPEPEALLTFFRLEHAVALVFRKEACGWRLISALGGWLRFEEYPYESWLSLPEIIEPGVHELLVRDSTSDATSYLRKARLLKLIDGSLEQVAQIDEERVEPADEYRGADWSEVKHRQMSRYTFLRETQQPEQPARIQIETTDEVIKYEGAAPAYTYWLETDGAWHASRKNWSTRAATRLKLLNASHEQLVWNEQEKRFVKS